MGTKRDEERRLCSQFGWKRQNDAKRFKVEDVDGKKAL